MVSRQLPATDAHGAHRSSLATRGLLVLAIGYTAYLTAPIAIPITAAFLLYFLFSPVIHFLTRRHVPRVIAAFGVSLSLTAFVCFAVYSLATPAIEWLEQAPESIADLRASLRNQANPLENIRQASDAVEEAVTEITQGEEEARDPPTSVRIVEPDLVDNLIQGIPFAVMSLGLTILLMTFLLLFGNQILRSIVRAGKTLSNQRRIVTVAHQIEADISRYLGTITLINTGLALVVAGVMHLLGLPNPLLWGAVAGLLNFAPYLGPIVTIFALFLASIEAMQGLQEMLMPPLVYLVITAIEGQVVTPLLVGQRLKLSPVVILLSVVVIGWIWGLVGALMAVPLVASFRIFLANLPESEGIVRLLAKE
jgi:predicted PurR-regulated permease PerM